MPRKMPPDRTESKVMTKTSPKIIINKLEVAKAAFPIFGGEDDGSTGAGGPGVGTEGKSDKGTGKAAPSTTSKSTSEPGVTVDDLVANPQALTDLLEKLNGANTLVQTLTEANAKFEGEKKNAERAKMDKETALQADLAEAQEVIAKMDAVIRHTALVNAIQGDKNNKFHSAKQVIAELSDDEFEIDVDLETGTANVRGMDKALARIAKDFYWLVAQDGTQQQNPRQGQLPPSTGRPPSNPNGGAKDAKRRESMLSRYPVLARSRARI